MREVMKKGQKARPDPVSIRLLAAVLFHLLLPVAIAQPVPNGLWVVIESMSIYKEPRVDSVVLSTVAWAQQVSPDFKRKSLSTTEWLPVKVDLRDGRGQLIRDEKKQVKYFDGWMRRIDLWDGKLEKVTACWPIKHIIYTMGDYEVEIYFKLDGSGVVLERSDEPRSQKGTLRTHAYMAQNIVQFSATNQDKRFLFSGGYKPSDRHLYPNGTLDYTLQTLFSEEELKGCKSSPTTESRINSR